MKMITAQQALELICSMIENNPSAANQPLLVRAIESDMAPLAVEGLDVVEHNRRKSIVIVCVQNEQNE